MHSFFENAKKAHEAGVAKEVVGERRKTKESNDTSEKLWEVLDESNNLEHVTDKMLDDVDHDKLARLLISQGPAGLGALMRGLKNLNGLSKETAEIIRSRGEALFLHSHENWREKTDMIIWENRDSFRELPDELAQKIFEEEQQKKAA